ncbi:MAG TPA: hypothetical protein VFQ31_04345, partial [Methyloceanibacter sp.]|nr:hypothetical protein [Methyloceanibacter sp.]
MPDHELRVRLAWLAGQGSRHFGGRRRRSTGRVVNVFLITLIIANGLAFAAETVGSVYERWGPEREAFNIFSVIVFTVEYLLRLWSSVEIPLYHRMPHWRARLNFALRPMMIIDLLAIPALLSLP